MENAGKIRITFGNNNFFATFGNEACIKEVLDLTPVRVNSGCRGNGACGLCKIKILNDHVPEPTVTEQYHLTAKELNNAVRLACQVVPVSGMHIQVINAAQFFGSSVIRPTDYYMKKAFFPVSDVPRDKKHGKYGLSVDLGSTNISAVLWDLYENKRISGRRILNKQAQFGSDVITRIVAANESGANAHRLSELALETIGNVIYDICSQDGYNPFEISAVSIVGNTAELALLCGRNYENLLYPKNWVKKIECACKDKSPWTYKWCINPNALIEIVPPVGGFIGSDLSAGVLATDMAKPGKCCLLLDFGTNTEIALWDGSILWVTSAAGGPAFEGCGLSSGIPAGPGAIYKIDASNNSPDFICHTIFSEWQSRQPKGICGSGIVDLIALLLDADIITSKGKFNHFQTNSYELRTGAGEFTLTKRDIDLFMRSKAAIGTGIGFLLKSSGVVAEEIDHIYICGAFGKNLNIPNAIKIGLLPVVNPNIIDLCGNTALAGCEMLLISSKSREKLELIKQKTNLINMANEPEFDMFYRENLFLRPMEVS
ncbi:MAG: Na(+)-translocating NADH-quinone reductase subunit F [Candidatus Dichloromethanomonas elyunquensis]|nr:MAG: Na(+)-translocating NADH-quinone reductase subunit F [Candidatus Dichloromethanomonas elyunquensis]